MQLQNNPQSKFQLIQSAVAAPGSCTICGKSQGPFIDFGFLAEFYGAVIFCVACAQDCGRSAGLVDQNVIGEATLRIHALEIYAANVDAALRNLQENINAAVDQFIGTTSTMSSSTLSSMESDGESEVKLTESEITDSEEFGTSSSSDESSSIEGPSDISDFAVDDDLFPGTGTINKSE